MKLRKVQLVRLLRNLMESYNAFISDEALERKSDAWYEKLQHQDEEFVTISISNWEGSKMPTAIDILHKCRSMNKPDIDFSKKDFICEYFKYSPKNNSSIECSNNLIYYHDGRDKFMICEIHKTLLDKELKEQAKNGIIKAIEIMKENGIGNNYYFSQIIRNMNNE